MGGDISCGPRELEHSFGFFSFVHEYFDIVVRGVAVPDTIRCDWYGFAQTVGQREEDLRFWLELDENEPVPSLSEIEERLMEIATIFENFPPDRIPRFHEMTYGGLFDSRLDLNCFMDYRVKEYILGNGPDVVTVVYTVSDVQSYDLYKVARQWWYARFVSDEDFDVGTRTEYELSLEDAARSASRIGVSLFEGREAVLSLAPMATFRQSIVLEGWSAINQWDLQLGEDGAVNTVLYGARRQESVYPQTLNSLREYVATVVESEEGVENRIANISDLTQFYRDIGAYEDITPNDGDDELFIPVQPPPVRQATAAPSTATPTPIHTPSLMFTPQTLKEYAAVACVEDDFRIDGLSRRAGARKLGERLAEIEGMIPLDAVRDYHAAFLAVMRRLLLDVESGSAGLVTLEPVHFSVDEDVARLIDAVDTAWMALSPEARTALRDAGCSR